MVHLHEASFNLEVKSFHLHCFIDFGGLQDQVVMAYCSFLHCPSAVACHKDLGKTLVLIAQVLEEEDLELHNDLEALIIHAPVEEAYGDQAFRHQKTLVLEVEIHHLKYLVLQILVAIN
tara:strand:- start:193 stop:549 length:357 start_codon:yes stop_codon:yes gene_type:complete